MFYRIKNEDSKKVDEYLKENNIEYDCERYISDMYGKLVADDILCCIEEDLPYISDRGYVINRASEALINSDYVGLAENEVICEAIHDAVETMPPLIINTDHLVYSKK